MKAKVHATCQPKSKAAALQYDAENIHIVVDLPFVPAAGTMLKVSPAGDYLKVDQVYLDLTEGGEGLVVFIEEPDDSRELMPWKAMKAEGWALG